jgi:hypothetical protein
MIEPHGLTGWKLSILSKSIEIAEEMRSLKHTGGYMHIYTNSYFHIHLSGIQAVCS